MKKRIPKPLYIKYLKIHLKLILLQKTKRKIRFRFIILPLYFIFESMREMNSHFD